MVDDRHTATTEGEDVPEESNTFSPNSDSEKNTYGVHILISLLVPLTSKFIPDQIVTT